MGLGFSPPWVSCLFKCHFPAIALGALQWSSWGVLQRGCHYFSGYFFFWCLSRAIEWVTGSLNGVPRGSGARGGVSLGGVPFSVVFGGPGLSSRGPTVDFGVRCSQPVAINHLVVHVREVRHRPDNTKWSGWKRGFGFGWGPCPTARRVWLFCQ